MSAKALIDEKTEAVQPIIDRYVKDPSCEAVYLSGSLMAGLGTPYSDIDVFVITEAAGTPGEADAVTQHGNGPDRLDVEFRRPGWLDRAAGLARPYTATVDDNHVLRTTGGLLEDTIRLTIGQVVKPSPRLARARLALAAGQPHLRRLMLAHRAADLGSYWMDALGFWAQDDQESLDLISRRILLTAVDAVCVTGGDLYRGEKWIWPRRRRWR